LSIEQEEIRAVRKKEILPSYIVWLLFILLISGCAGNIKKERNVVSDSIEERIGKRLSPLTEKKVLEIPEGINLNDGLTEDESISIALWNNALFQADLAQLGFAKADLVEAGMIKNPAFSLLFPVGPKQLEWAFNLPLEVLWQRPNRVAYAKLNLQAISNKLIQDGLGLVKTVLSEYAELIKREEMAKIMGEESEIQEEMLFIAEARLAVGDISEIEAAAFRLEAFRIKESALEQKSQAEIQKVHFKTMLGIAGEDYDVNLSPENFAFNDLPPVENLLQTAEAARPDFRAAEISVEAAGKRLGWERSKIVNLTAVLDANGQGKEGFEMGPGVQFEVPLLNWNQGGTSRASAQMNQAAKQYLVVKHQIYQDVHEAYENYITAKQLLTLLQNRTIPEAQKAVQNSQKAYEIGDISYFEFLDFKRQLLGARLREAESAANLRKAEANLRFSIGFKPIN
jgi:cobalt-zinc-cadmium efflux system outer membrane protein